MTTGSGDPDEVVLDALRRAVAQAPRRPAAIEVDIRLSILLGQQRPSVSCGGCSVDPLRGWRRALRQQAERSTKVRVRPGRDPL
ncbi:MAG: hypothetical protein M1606_03240, partial [Candidatus Thermoplasmatota archaeon]|nr:hypothetical protein [Candidatus Thermoplasmatota archaeon]